MKLELVVLNSFIEIFRNSVADDCLYLYFNKLGLWSTGLWGDDCGDLLKNGRFEFEVNPNDPFNKTDSFKDPMSETAQDGVWNTGYHEKSKAPQISNDDTFKIMIEGIQMRTAMINLKSTLFAEFDQKCSLEMEIIFEDNDFNFFPQDENFMKRKFTKNL